MRAGSFEKAYCGKDWGGEEMARWVGEDVVNSSGHEVWWSSTWVDDGREPGRTVLWFMGDYKRSVISVRTEQNWLGPKENTTWFPPCPVVPVNNNETREVEQVSLSGLEGRLLFPFGSVQVHSSVVSRLFVTHELQPPGLLCHQLRFLQTPYPLSHLMPTSHLVLCWPTSPASSSQHRRSFQRSLTHGWQLLP